MNEINYLPIITILCFGIVVLQLVIIICYIKSKKLGLNFFKRKQRVEDLRIIRPEFLAESKKERERQERERRKKKLKIVK